MDDRERVSDYATRLEYAWQRIESEKRRKRFVQALGGFTAVVEGWVDEGIQNADTSGK